MLLETRVSVLETRLNLLETKLTSLKQLVEDQTKANPKGKRPLEFEGDTDLVFIKTLSICNTGRSIDIQV